jgi:hypothetical protein
MNQSPVESFISEISNELLKCKKELQDIKETSLKKIETLETQVVKFKLENSMLKIKLENTYSDSEDDDEFQKAIFLSLNKNNDKVPESVIQKLESKNITKISKKSTLPDYKSYYN